MRGELAFDIPKNCIDTADSGSNNSCAAAASVDSTSLAGVYAGATYGACLKKGAAWYAGAGWEAEAIATRTDTTIRHNILNLSLFV